MKGNRIGMIDSVPAVPRASARGGRYGVRCDAGFPRSLAPESLSRLRLASDPQLAADGTMAYVQSWLDLDADATRRTVVLVPGAAGPPDQPPTPG